MDYYRYSIYDYEVWGNEKDGYNVNDVFPMGIEDFIVAQDATDREILKGLKSAAVIFKHLHYSNFEILGDREHTLYIDYRGMPVCELRLEARYLERANDCIINDMFIDVNDPEYYRDEYCQKNCHYRCKNGKDYKKSK